MNIKTPSFEEAINIAMLWCNAWESGELSDEVLADRVSELLISRDGLRGFFVVSLASDCPLMDRLPEALVIQLRSTGETVVDLIVRNLAMSSAMAITHKNNSDSAQQTGSERVTSRCIDLLRILEPNSVRNRLEQLLNGLEGKGKDVIFLERWKYDSKQKAAIAESIQSVAEN